MPIIIIRLIPSQRPVATLNSRILTIIVGLLGIGSAWILSLMVVTQALNLPDLGEKVFPWLP